MKCCKCHRFIDQDEFSNFFEGKLYCDDCWNIGKPKEMETIEPLNLTQGKYESIAKSIGKLVEEKNKAYGDSFNKCGEFLKILYPDGVSVEHYEDMLGLVRVFDKMMRIATAKDALGENPWKDIVGYGLLRSESDNA